jgi:hypothetical protein
MPAAIIRFRQHKLRGAAIRVVWHKLRLPQAPTLRTLLHPAQRLPMAPKSETRPYTAALLAAMDKTDISIEQTFKVVRQQLKQQGQEPWKIAR